MTNDTLESDSPLADPTPTPGGDEGATADEGGGNTEMLPVTGTLGIERWIQFAYIAFALTLFWFFDHLIVAIWEIFADSDPTIASAGAAILALIGAFAAYRHPRASAFSNEVADELSKVVWPSREETWNQTLIVLAVSAIAAAIFFVFDATWSKLSDLIYTL